jgi:hypothetical protein
MAKSDFTSDRMRSNGRVDGKYRGGDFRHGAFRGLARRQLGMFLHHALDVLDDDYGVVDHDADG